MKKYMFHDSISIMEKEDRRLLLHCCCGPCSTASIERLLEEGITPSKELDLYRQDYCGCEFSMRKG